jgi:multidrug transporter EmrE-like cation transporter
VPETIARFVIVPDVDVLPLKIILKERGVQIAYNIWFAVGVSVVNAVVPEAVVDQPLNVYPVLVIVPTVANEVMAADP